MLTQKQQQRNWLKQYNVQDLSRSIIRQYLMQNKLTQTLKSLEIEDKRSQKKIKKSVLVKILSMNNLIYFNKQSKQPYCTILDTLVGYLKDKFRMKIELSCYEDNDSNTNTNKYQMENSLKDSEPEIKLDKSLNNTVKLENQRNNKLINSKISQAEKLKRPVTSGSRVSGKNVQNIYAQLSKIDFEENQKKKLVQKQKQELERKNRMRELQMIEKEKKINQEKQRIEALERIRLAQAEKQRKQEERQRREREQQKQRDRKAVQERKIQEKKQAEQKERKRKQQDQKRKKQQQLKRQQEQKRRQQQQRRIKQRQIEEIRERQRQRQRKKKQQQQQERQKAQKLHEERQKIVEKQKQQDIVPQQTLHKQPSKENTRTGMRKLNRKKQTEPSGDFKIEQEHNTSKREKQVHFILDDPQKIETQAQNQIIPETIPKKQQEKKMVVIGGKRKKNNQQTQKVEEKKFKFDDNFVDQPLRGNEQKYVYEKLQFNKITLKNPTQPTINYRQKPLTNKKPTQKPITQQLAQQLKKAVFQTSTPILPKSWYQGFILSPHPNTPYGLQQIQGGPCGIIAAIQCYFLKHLLHLSKPTVEELSNETLRENCLVAAITDMLFKSRSSDKIVLALPPKSFAGLKLDISSFRIVTLEASTFSQAYQSLYQYKSSFIGKNNHGVAVLMFCMVMTKGIENIWSDMDMPDNPLIGHHGHCTQQLVNLFITGHASSNIFDGITNLDQITLKGIPQKSQFGFLTIYETNQQLHVGKNLKNPIYPFWIICKQFHYHVIFTNHYLISQNNNTNKFDIVYFDGLYNCADRIVITLESYGFEDGEERDKVKVKDLPLIQQVMKTKWGLRRADWNGSMKIL